MNEFHPKVSIVIPVYNGSNYLREAIDSALSQTYQNREILVVNDGSADGGKTEEIAKSYGDKIRYFHKDNGGVASALNFGINKMTGQYFSWLSHDDVYYPDKVEAQLQFLKKTKNDVVLYSDFDFIDHASKYLRSHRIKHIKPEGFRYALLTGHPIHGCTVLIPKVCFDTVGIFNEALRTTQDYDLWFRMAKIYAFVHLPEVLIQSRIHEEQSSRSLDSIHMKACNTLYKDFISAILAQKEHAGKFARRSKTLFCAEIAVNLQWRGYYDAADYAFVLSSQFLAGSENTFNIKYIIMRVLFRVCFLFRKINDTYGQNAG